MVGGVNGEGIDLDVDVPVSSLTFLTDMTITCHTDYTTSAAYLL